LIICWTRNNIRLSGCSSITNCSNWSNCCNSSLYVLATLTNNMLFSFRIMNNLCLNW
jgi:hypothetical protein